MLRRIFLSQTLLAPAAIYAAAPTRSWTEIEKLLARGAPAGRVTKQELPTPALVLDLDAFENNVALMAKHCRDRKLALRPHGKTHKCPEIAQRLIAAGAVGCCAAKLSEAEVFARSGVRGLLVTTAVVGPYKIERAVRLAASRPDTIFSVDNTQNVTDLDEAAKARKVTLNLAVDVNVGGRTGIAAGEPSIALARFIHSRRNVKLAGLQAYAGQASHTKGFAERARASREAMQPAVEIRRALEKDGVPCPLLTGGSTGTYNIDCDIEGITEIQPGSFVFMDTDYNRIGGRDGEVYRDFRNSLTVLTTVVSKPSDSYCIVDGGFKALATDRPFPPELAVPNGGTYRFAGDEHGRIDLSTATAPVNLGDRLEFIVPHCDPTVNLYDRIFCTRGDRVEQVWTIAARGMSQ